MLVEKHFPTCVTSGKIDKTKLAQVIFEDPQKRSTLNKIAHPLILKSLFDQMLNTNSQITFAEVPLLFEEGLEDRFDGVIVIKREISERIKAIQLRDKISKEAAEKRIFSQFDYYTKDAIHRFQKCNAIVIENNDNILILEKQVDNALNSIMQRQT
jgi:dephospho-CoA kinase